MLPSAKSFSALFKHISLNHLGVKFPSFLWMFLFLHLFSFSFCFSITTKGLRMNNLRMKGVIQRISIGIWTWRKVWDLRLSFVLPGVDIPLELSSLSSCWWGHSAVWNPPGCPRRRMISFWEQTGTACPHSPARKSRQQPRLPELSPARLNCILSQC